jgi:hypothetical protein
MDPTLKQARAEIQAILDRYDIAGFVALHRPGNGECWLHIAGPSYSKMTGGPVDYRIRSQLVDYGGDVAAQKRDLESTAQMLHTLAQMTAEMALPLMALSTDIDKKVGATHQPGRHEPDPPKGAH